MFTDSKGRREILLCAEWAMEAAQLEAAQLLKVRDGHAICRQALLTSRHLGRGNKAVQRGRLGQLDRGGPAPSVWRRR